MSKFISTNRLILFDGSMYEFFLSNVSFLLHWHFGLMRDLRQKKLSVVLPVLDTVSNSRVQKTVVHLAESVAVLLVVHGLLFFLVDVYILLDQSGVLVWLPVTGPVDNMICLCCLVCGFVWQVCCAVWRSAAESVEMSQLGKHHRVESARQRPHTTQTSRCAALSSASHRQLQRPHTARWPRWPSMPSSLAYMCLLYFTLNFIITLHQHGRSKICKDHKKTKTK